MTTAHTASDAAAPDAVRRFAGSPVCQLASSPVHQTANSEKKPENRKTGKPENTAAAPSAGSAEQGLRTALLLGDDAVARLRAARVLLFGLGGVGSYAAEALARSGVGHITLVDHDLVGPTNLNRQLGALHSTLGRPKVDVLRDRILDIDPTIEVMTLRLFYRPEEAAKIDFASFDYILDAIDTVRAKVDIVQRSFAAGVPVVSCMGMGNRLDPTAVRVGDLAGTSVCPLCRAMRKKLRKVGIEHLRVVYSVETPREVPEIHDNDELTTAKRPTPGSIVFVPAAAGMALAGEAVRCLAARTAGPDSAPLDHAEKGRKTGDSRELCMCNGIRVAVPNGERATGNGERETGNGFTLVEVLVALALTALVLVPAVLYMGRLLKEDRTLDERISSRLLSRESPPPLPTGNEKQP